MIRVTSGNIYQEYDIASTTTASTAQQLAYNVTNSRQKLILEAVGDRQFFKFGDSTVVASKTLTGNVVPAGNFSVPAGAIFEVDLPTGVNQNFVSVISASTSGTAIIRLSDADI